MKEKISRGIGDKLATERRGHFLISDLDIIQNFRSAFGDRYRRLERTLDSRSEGDGTRTVGDKRIAHSINYTIFIAQFRLKCNYL